MTGYIPCSVSLKVIYTVFPYFVLTMKCSGCFALRVSNINLAAVPKLMPKFPAVPTVLCRVVAMESMDPSSLAEGLPIVSSPKPNKDSQNRASAASCKPLAYEGP